MNRRRGAVLVAVLMCAAALLVAQRPPFAHAAWLSSAPETQVANLPPMTVNTATPKPSTILLHEATTDLITGQRCVGPLVNPCSDVQLTFSGSTSELSIVQAGSVIVGAPAPNLQLGIMGIVGAVNTSSSPAVVLTVNRTGFQSAVSNLSISSHHLLRGDQVDWSRSSLAPGVSLGSPTDNGASFPLSFNQDLGDGVSVNGSATLEFTWDLDIGADFGGGNAHFAASMGVGVSNMSITGSWSAVSANLDQSLGDLTLFDQWIWVDIGGVPFPVDLAFKFEPRLDASLNVAFSSTATVTAAPQATVGIEYTESNGNWSGGPTSSFTMGGPGGSWQPSSSTVNGTGSAQITVKPDFEISADNLLGLTFGLEPYAAASISAPPLQAQVALGLQGEVGGAMDVFSVNFSFTIPGPSQTVFQYTAPTATPTPTSTPRPTPTPTPSSYPTGMYGPGAGCCFWTTGGWTPAWRVPGGSHGLIGQTVWTMSNGPTESAGANWRPNNLRSGVYYQIAVYVPDCCSDARAHYLVTDGSGQQQDFVVNQNPITNNWQVLGGFWSGSGGSSILVHLTNAGDPRGSTYIGADAVSFQLACPGGCH